MYIHIGNPSCVLGGDTLGWGLLGRLLYKEGVGRFLGPNFGQWSSAN